MKCPLCLNHIVSMPIQPAVEGKYCIPNRPREMEEIKASQSGKFYNANVTV